MDDPSPSHVDPQIKIANLLRILSVNRKINSSLNLDELLNTIMETAAQVMATEAASLLLLDEVSKELVFRVALGEKGTELTEKFRVKMGEGIAGTSAQNNESIIVNDTRNDERFSQRFDKDTGFDSRAIICTPLRSKGKVIGVLEALNPIGRTSFDDGDLELFEVFADQVCIAIDNALLHAEIVKQEKAKQELSIAKEIQANLLPTISQETFGIDIVAQNDQARDVGGDFYDVINIDENRVGILIADVSGKGVPAALFMVNAISHFRFLAPSFPEPATLFNKLNPILNEASTLGMFMTTLYILYDKKEKFLKYSSAGHHSILMKQASGEVRELDNVGGIPLGLSNDSLYEEQNYKTQQGDSFFLYTDGIIEARNKKQEEYGLPLLSQLLTDTIFKSAEEYAKKIFEDLNQFSKDADQHDDMTLIVFKTNDA